VTAGLVVVDKPAGLTSHDVVARVRRLAGTRKVGHAGTLDPMATGVLLVGVGAATRLLGHLALADKAYDATVRLGMSTVTDDAQGEPTGGASADDVTEADVRAGLRALSGELLQVPSAVSAVKVDGVRSYARVRDGQPVELAARPVTVHRFQALASRRPAPGILDVDVVVECSTGTYVRALARDLGASLGVGGHLTTLRRTRVGPYTVDRARTLDELGEAFAVEPLASVVESSFGRVDVDAAAATDIGYGRPLPLDRPDRGTNPVGVFGPDGEVLALMHAVDGRLRPLVVFAAR
jgi:tRNA pseudouridine55 synthase